MCNFLSMIVTKSDLLWSKKSDHHENIIKRFRLNDGIRGGDFVRIEMTPPQSWDGISLEGWTFNTDLYVLPDWYSAKEAETCVRSRLKAVLNSITAKDGQVIDGGRWIVLKGTVELKDGYCYAYGSSVINQSGGICRVFRSSIVNLSGGRCHAYKRSTVNQSGGWCWADGTSTVNLSGGFCHAFQSSTVNQSGGECEIYSLNATLNKVDKG